MSRPRTFDELEVLDRAMDVFWRRGYEGATMAELTAAMRVTAPSVYTAFGSKRGLFEAVLNRYSVLQEEHTACVLSAPTAREVAERMLFGAAEELPAALNSVHPAGCLLIQAGLTAGPDNSDVPKELARRRQAGLLILRDRFDRAKAEGDLPAGADSAELASFVVTIFEGMSVRAAGGATTDELRNVAEQAMAGWQARVAALGEPTAGPSPCGADDFKASMASDDADAVSPAETRGRPREFSPDVALAAALEVFWRKGYEGASLTDLTRAMGITRPSLYAAFGNKEALFCQVLDLYQRENMAYVRDAFEARTARAMVERLLDGALKAQNSGAGPRGCLAVINSMQCGDEARSIRATILARAAEGHAACVARLERARAEGDLPPSSDPEGLARMLGSVLQGIALQGSAGATPAELRSLVDAALAAWPTK